MSRLNCIAGLRSDFLIFIACTFTIFWTKINDVYQKLKVNCTINARTFPSFIIFLYYILEVIK